MHYWRNNNYFKHNNIHKKQIPLTMTREYDIPNNLSQDDKNWHIEQKQKEWASYIQPQDADIMIINGSSGARFVFYKNRWNKF